MAVGGGGAYLLVAAEDVADVSGASERLVDLHRCASGVCKDCVHAFPFEGLDQNVAAFSGLTIEAIHPAYTPCQQFSSDWAVSEIKDANTERENLTLSCMFRSPK